MASVGLPKESSMGGSAQRSPPHTSQQGQAFQPMDKASSQTVKLNPKLELSHTELLKLLSYMEAELQARDVVIATLKTERIKSLLAYGRGGVHDPVLALQRDTACASVTSVGVVAGAVGGEGTGSGAHMRGLQDTQLTQLEHLIAQQRKAHQRMRHVLREAEKRHSRVVGELEEERRKHEHDTAQGDDVTYALERDRARLKQTIESERSLRRTAEAECSRLTSEREEQRGRHKQMVLLLLEDRNRLAAQAAHHRHRAEELAKVVSEEKGRMDGMAVGLEEESKKSLQMEAELEKQLAQFDTERQQMRALLQRRDDRVEELESHVEKLQRDVCHYQKQLQEAHNVAMFQQTLSVSPPRLVASSPAPSLSAVVTGVTLSQSLNVVSIPNLSQQQQSSPVSVTVIGSGTSLSAARLPVSCTAGSVGKTATLPSGMSVISRPQPPQLPAKPPQLQHQARLPGTLPPPKVSSRVRASSPGMEDTPPLPHSVLTSQTSSSHVSTAHSPTPPSLSHSLASTPLFSGGMVEAGGVGVSKAVQLTATVNSVPVTMPTTGIARGVAPQRSVLYQPPSCGEGCEVLAVGSSSSQVVQLSPRVNVSASGSGKVITSSQGGKFTFQVSTSSSPASQHGGASYINQGTQQQQQQQVAPAVSRKPLPPARSVNSANCNTARSSTSNSSCMARNAGHSSSLNTTASSRAIDGGAPPPLPPNKPLLLATTTAAITKKDAPISLELKSHKLGLQTLKFGITISKSPALNSSTTASSTGVTGQAQVAGAGDLDAPALIDTRRDVAQVTQTS